MNRLWQGLLLLALVLGFAAELEAKDELQGEYKAPTINRRLFGESLSMVNNERDEYASNLAAIAVLHVNENKGSQKSLDYARQLLGLALHLSPRNRKSVVANRQLQASMMPKKVAADYDPEVFARLLLARGQLLEKQEGKANAQLSRYFVALAAMIDPRNEDAIYESEMHRIDHGDLTWSDITDAKTERMGITPAPQD
ncbi:hypothetical protein HW115_01825 [Verrucomicrobiaceae bacterium N1E253]|uniref:MxaK protein n=1 Tax=Oceaniferula marina TaxID=2748318 RepID=A0A851GBL5_9BACT|nr:hypothetical protein [Oceaniferula marina]NWK54332.1 hypothetical protein [Oceaniferula marina]